MISNAVPDNWGLSLKIKPRRDHMNIRGILKKRDTSEPIRKSSTESGTQEIKQSDSPVLLRGNSDLQPPTLPGSSGSGSGSSGSGGQDELSSNPPNLNRPSGRRLMRPRRRLIQRTTISENENLESHTGHSKKT